MYSKKIKQWFQRFFITEHDWGEMTVEKLDTIANGRRSVGARKWCIEWLKIKLKHIIIIEPNTSSKTQKDEFLQTLIKLETTHRQFWNERSKILLVKQNWREQRNCLHPINKLFFEAKIFRNTQLIHTKFMDIDTNIFPNTRPWSNSNSHKRR